MMTSNDPADDKMPTGQDRETLPPPASRRMMSALIRDHDWSLSRLDDPACFPNHGAIDQRRNIGPDLVPDILEAPTERIGMLVAQKFSISIIV